MLIDDLDYLNYFQAIFTVETSIVAAMIAKSISMAELCC
jgi:hypothetical protein